MPLSFPVCPAPFAVPVASALPHCMALDASVSEFQNHIAWVPPQQPAPLLLGVVGRFKPSKPRKMVISSGTLVGASLLLPPGFGKENPPFRICEKAGGQWPRAGGAKPWPTGQIHHLEKATPAWPGTSCSALQPLLSPADLHRNTCQAATSALLRS